MIIQSDTPATLLDIEEGLRSGSISVKPEDKVLPGDESEVNDNKQKCFDLNDEGSSKTDSRSDYVKEMVEFKERNELVNDECGETGLDEDEGKGSRVDGEENKDDGVVIKRVEEDYKMQNIGMVLRSKIGIKSGSEKESFKAEIEKKYGHKGNYGSENERDVDVQMEASNETNDAEGRNKVKGKRGRPPRVQKSDEFEGEEKKKSYMMNPRAALLDMNGSLGSGSVSVKPEDEVLSGEENEVNDNKQKCFDLKNDEVNPKMDPGSDSEKEMVEIKERDGQGNDECGETGLGKEERNRSRVDGEENNDNGVVIKKVKEDCEVQSVGRVLRSRWGIKSRTKKETNKAGIEKNDGNKGVHGSENERDVSVQMEVRNETNVVEGRMKVKGKRGRPLRMQENDESKGEDRKKLYNPNARAMLLDMKESLRSESISVKPKDKVMPREENEVNNNKQKCFDLNDEVSLKMDSGCDLVKNMVEIKERDVQVNDKCGEIGLDEDERKGSRGDGEENKDDGVVIKRVEEDYKMQNIGRVLRSKIGIKSGSEKESFKAEIGKKYGHKGDYGSENERDVDVQMEASNEINDAEERKKVKGKRGRPPRVQKSDEFEGEERKKSKVKRGRPPKVHQIDEYCDQGRKKVKNKCDRPQRKAQENYESDGEGSEMLRSRLGRPFLDGSDDAGRKRPKKKRGRPRKVQGSNGVLKGKKVNGFGKSRMDALSDGLKSDMPTYWSSLEKTNTGKESEAMSRLTLKHENLSEEKVIETKQEKTLPRNKAKQLLRDRIVELLLGAGWKIEYRPRSGKEYNDAVYVNPEGRTHWSVTLAYRVLKQHYDGGGGNYDTSKTGFTFTPIPEDELNILKKVMNKTKSDKLKKKKGKDTGTDDEIVTKKKKNKGKVNSTANLNSKLLKRGMKEKPSLSECCNLVGISHKGMSVPARKCKLQKTQNRKRCALLVRNSVEGAESDGDGFVAYDGKRTVLAWLIDTGTVPLNGKVQYWNQRKTRVMLHGQITRDGILCDCCGEILTISKFEAHSKSKLCHPFQNICLESGSSLLQCILDSLNKQEESKCKGFHFVDFGGEDPNDDTCGICGDGGDLICCDGCPSTFHQSCLDIKKFPSGKWHCVYCTCKFCGRVDENTCYMADDDHNDSAISMLQICILCEEKYHQSCSLAEDAVNYESSSLPFCGNKCREIFERLQMILGVKHELEEGYTWSLIQRSDVGPDFVLSDACLKVECNAKLAVALFVMDECFLPLPDHRSGINLIHNIVYNFGSNFKRLNYCGFFTAILERDDEIVSAASIRIHGKELAEMPFIGTRHMYRRQGMCRRLLVGIESALCSLNVEKLVIPAISELRETWTSVFGFKPLEESSKQKMKNMSLLVFPGVDLLQKPTLKNQFTEKNLISVTESSQFEFDGVGENSDDKYSNEFDRFPLVCKIHEETAALESSLRFPDGSILHTFGVASENVNFLESSADANCIDQLGMTGDDLQVDDKTAVNTGGDEQTEDVGDSGGQVSHVLELSVKSIPLEVEIENGIVKQNPKFCDEAAAHESAKIGTTEHQNLNFLSGLKVSSENILTCDSEVQIFHGIKVVEDQDPRQFIGYILESGGGICEAHEVRSDLVFSQNMFVASGDMIQNLTEGCRAHTGNNSNCSADQISVCLGNGLEAGRSPSFQLCMSNGHCLSADETTSSKATVVDGPDPEEMAVSLDGNQIPDGFQIITESPKHPGSDSQVHHAGVAYCNTESSCDINPVSGVALHCASSGGNSCGKAEVIILSNRAS